ncbi:phosphotransferase family protein [Mycobacterium sp. MYCO198283]|uniref:phosphotransferase family protein n=1 Tax=Mycobacterium sp. MYCO198283 TaxID=2883505 RepID=UPI001E520912|nr:phosphotransferase family protein [Mycobacterium sp. MYCO198283]MCG5434333.1 phosphotransferase family protein [Mycobacterium sp. MYCO198283]
MTETLRDDEVAALQTWVAARGIGTTVGAVEPLGGGTQNIVVRVEIDGRPLVLRRPPAHPRPNSNKTMLREIAVLRTLTGSDVPHPALIAACEDVDVIGVVFYLMAEIDGFNPGTEVAPAYVERPDFRHDVGISYATGLARLSRVPWEGSPLAALKRPGSFLERQVPQFRGFLDAYRQQQAYDDALPDVDALADWLAAHRPADGEPCIMHGDCHLNNVLLRRDRPEVAAFVDWEMCTVGDPLLDLGWMLVCWPVDADPLGSGEALARLGGLATRGELLAAYTAAGGRTTAHLDWYSALACFKLGVVIEGTWVRYLAGQAPRDAGERLHAAAVALIGLGNRIAAGEPLV